jgi:hypothetical protein
VPQKEGKLAQDNIINTALAMLLVPNNGHKSFISNSAEKRFHMMVGIVDVSDS